MSTIRHRLSQLVGLSEDSTADSDASTSALRSPSTPSETNTDISASTGRSRGNSIFSAASECFGTAASSLEQTSVLTPRPDNPNSPGKLKKAVSTTFQTFSNTLRSRTHIFYAATETDRPKTPPSEQSNASDNLYGGQLCSPGKKGASRSPRKALKDIFTSPGRSTSRDRIGWGLYPSRDISPSPMRSSLWSSIKGRASREHQIAVGVGPAEPDSQSSPQSLIEDSAPSLDVDIPNGSLTVSQLPEGIRSRALRGSSSRPSTPIQLSKSSREMSSQEALHPSDPRTTPDRTHVRFLELTPKSRVSGVQSVRKSSPNPFFTNGNSSIKHSTGVIGHAGSSPRCDEPDASQEAPTASPNTPNMGPKNVWEQARADRESRYRALTDSETNSDLELEESLTTKSDYRLGQPYSTELESSSRTSELPKSELQYAVEAIDRSPGEISDTSDLSRPKPSPYVPDFSGDLHYAVEAIERSPGTLYDVASSSSSSISDVHQNEPQSPSPDIRYAIQAMQGVFGTNVNYLRSGVSFSVDKVNSIHCEERMNAIYDSEGTDDSISLSRPPTRDSYTRDNPDLPPLAAPPYPAPHSLRKLRETNDVVAAENLNLTAAVGDSSLVKTPAERADTASQALESDHGFDQQPVTGGVFDPNKDMKHTAEPLTFGKGRMPIEEQLELTAQADSPGKEQMLTPARVPLPASPYSTSRGFDLPIRLRSQLYKPVLDNQSQNGPQKADDVEKPLTDSKPPVFTEPSTSTGKKKKKKSPKRKKSLKKLSPSKKDSRALVEISGNAEKEYSYSQIANGDRQVDTLKEGFKEAHLGTKADTPEVAEQRCQTSSPEKGVWWAREDESMGESGSPSSPTLKRALPHNCLEGLREQQESAYNSNANRFSALQHTEREAMDSTTDGPWDEIDKAAVAEHLRNVVEGITRDLKENKPRRDFVQ
ncbi:MAG: hypothetical protein Q9191_001309 [Dirinaria sp. TL-2023a]